MTEMSRRFNFDDFDQQIADALEEHEQLQRTLRPGSIGAVPTRMTTDLDTLSIPDPAEPV